VKCIDNLTSPLVGTYTVPALSSTNTSYVYITFFADGVYIYGSIEDDTKVATCDAVNSGNGVEYGVYNYSGGTFTIKSAVVDTNGRCGVWDNVTNVARFGGTLAVGGTAGQDRVLTLTLPDSSQIVLQPVASTPNQIAGSWAFPYEKNFVVFLQVTPLAGLNFYDMVTGTQQDTPPTDAAGFLAGVEYACASVSSLTGGTLTPDLSATCQPPRPSGTGPIDLNGGFGLSSAGATVPFTISTDTLTSGDLVLTRIKPN
jgi:hypothetical protein